MEIPRHWRLKEQRYKLLGFKITQKDGGVEYEFPPKSNLKSTEVTIFSSKLPLNTSGSCMASPGKEPQPQEQ